MSYMAFAEYGPFASIVATAGAIMSATGALIMGFRRGAKWEPVEIDLDRGPRRVSSLLAAIGIVLVWSQLQNNNYMRVLVVMVLILGTLTFLFLVLYGYFIQVYTFEKIIVTAAGAQKKINIE